MAPTASEVERLLALPYHIVIVHDDTGDEEGPWLARVEELPGCEVRDQTADGAARLIPKAMEDWLEAALERGTPVPEPRRAPSHSGRLLLRIPQGLHAALAHKADTEEVSLNGLITGMLAGAVGWQRDGVTDEQAVPLRSVPAAGEGAERSRFLPVAIVVNIVAGVLAALAAIALLILAWQNGW
jgi:predicted HicB family RNase H-like nuclease